MKTYAISFDGSPGAYSGYVTFIIELVTEDVTR